MTLNDMLRTKGFDLKQVLVMRHRPIEPGLNKVLPWLAAERPEFFNAFQQTQGPKEERAMQKAEFVASFIRYGPGKALFIGLYKIAGHRPMTREQFWGVPAYIEMKKFGMRGFTGEEEGRDFVLWFDLDLVPDFYGDWKGKLVVGWPKPDRAWCRRAHEPHNIFPVLAVAEESVLDTGMPRWDDIVLGWEELGVLPSKWKAKLSEWRGIYYIFDTSVGKGYVCSAYGETNLLGRWQTYADSGHGGNALLRHCDPKHFLFTILQRVSPDADSDDVIRLESSWKQRLHTRDPLGLNDN
jgi:hypothetical protein